jgi:hypothetical protein
MAKIIREGDQYKLVSDKINYHFYPIEHHYTMYLVTDRLTKCHQCNKGEYVSFIFENDEYDVLDDLVNFNYECKDCNITIFTIVSKTRIFIQKKNRPSQNKSRWTSDEIGLLFRMILDNRTIYNIANRIGRSYNAIFIKFGLLIKKFVDNYKSSKKIRVVQFLSDIWNNMDLEKTMNEYGFSFEFCRNILYKLFKFSEMSVPKVKYINGVTDAIKWLNHIMKIKNIFIKHANNGGEYWVPMYFIRVNGFCEKTNTVYLFYVCHSHGCKRCYSPLHLIGPSNIENQEAVEKLRSRRNFFRRLNYHVKTIRECVWKDKIISMNKIDIKIKNK